MRQTIYKSLSAQQSKLKVMFANQFYCSIKVFNFTEMNRGLKEQLSKEKPEIRSYAEVKKVFAQINKICGCPEAARKSNVGQSFLSFANFEAKFPSLVCIFRCSIFVYIPRNCDYDSLSKREQTSAILVLFESRIVHNAYQPEIA